MKDSFKVSVIVPFYKGNEYLEQLFSCISKNATKIDESVELILINDSPRYEVNYKEEWIDGFELVFKANEKNSGIQKSRINGLKMSRGKYVIFLDQDDALEDNAIESHLSYIQDADVVVGNGINENRKNSLSIYKSVNHQKLVSSLNMYLNVGCMIVSPGQCMIKKDCIPNEWTEHLIATNGADDYFLWLLLICKNRKFRINPQKIYTHVDTGENLSNNFNHMIRSSIEVLDILIWLNLLTEAHKKRAIKRFNMRGIYEGKGKKQKIIAFIKYPYFAMNLLFLFLIQKIK